MAIATIELGELIESGFDIGLDKYPIFDESYRDRLNGLILDRYWFREIGCTPPAKWARRFKRKMNEIMPYYNLFYKSTVYEFNPLYTTDVTTEGKTESQSKGKGSRTSSDDGMTTATVENQDRTRSLFSTTPQLQLQGNEDYANTVTDGQSDAKNKTVQDSRNTTTDVSENADNALTDYITKTYGYSGINAGEMLQRYRDSLVNVDLLVLDELKVLFWQLWATNVNGV